MKPPNNPDPTLGRPHKEAAEPVEGVEELDVAVGRRLETRRVAAGLSQEALSKRIRLGGLNWSQGTLSRVETGARPMRLVEALVVAGVLGVDVLELTPSGDELASGVSAETGEQPRIFTTRATEMAGRKFTLNDFGELLAACHDWPSGSPVVIDILANGEVVIAAHHLGSVTA